jgi:hypothetical protein
MAVLRRFAALHEDCGVSSVQLVDDYDGKLVFLVYYSRRLPSRPAPYFAYEYSEESQSAKELSEIAGECYRPRSYK